MYLIYCHTNKLNGKKYFGLTSTSIEKRAGKNGRGYSQCPYFYRAIQKYGWDGFTHEVIENNLTKDEACEREIHYISEYKTYEHLYGYNIQYGGQTGNQSEESRKKMSESIKKACKRPEVIERKSKAAKQMFIDNPELRKVYGSSTRGKEITKKKVLFSDKEINRIREEAKNSQKKAVNAKSVLWVEYNIIFASVSEAARITKLKSVSIAEACNGKHKTAYGYHWKYIDNEVPVVNQNCCKIKCIETGVVYKSIKEAESTLLFNKGSISRVLNGAQELAGGYHWEYVDNKNHKHGGGKKIKCIETNEIFNSVLEAERKYKIIDIHHALRNCNFMSGGYHWIYLNEDDIPKDYYKASKNQLINQIFCSTNNKTYSNATEASLDLGMSRASVLKVAHGIAKQAKGYEFRFAHPELR